MGDTTDRYTAFAGARRIAAATTIEDVARAVKAYVDGGGAERVAIFEDATGTTIDIDLRGTADDVVARLATHPYLGHRAAGTAEDDSGGGGGARRRGPGRPKLGVVAREVTLLPRHWDWLARQTGGASATLRRLVDRARREGRAEERARDAVDAAHRFLWDMAGDLPDFEAVSRALYAGELAAVADATAAWPADIRAYLLDLTRVAEERAAEAAEAARR